MELKDKVIIITGASSGIGEAATGYKVYGSNRRGTPSAHPSFEILALDVTDGAFAPARLVDAGIRKDLRLDRSVS